MDLVKTFKNNILALLPELANKQASLILGVSGGLDSVCLLDLVQRSELNIACICHINHGLRSSAKRDENFVATLAKHYNVTFELLQTEPKKIAVT